MTTALHRRLPVASPLTVLFAVATTPLLTGTARAFDLNDQIAINGLLAGAFQCQALSGGADVPDVCRGGGAFQPEIVYTPTEQDQVFVKFGLGAGNGLNDVSPFALSPWAADLEADVRDINGRDRSYLLEAWYAHTFKFSESNSLQITGGIMDPAFYVNENVFANDEYTQFMNEVFVNARNAFLPAYDLGGAVVWKLGDWTFSGLGMNVGENDEGRDYNWFGAEIDYHLETRLGEGNYRLLYSGTSREFAGPAETGAEDDTAVEQGDAVEVPGQTRLEHRSGWLLSFDQQLGAIVGAFLRLGWQAEDALVDYKAEYSGGFDFKGAAWGREQDNIGIGYAYLDGGNSNISRTNAFEAYYRFAFNDYLAITGDLQYMQDKYRGEEDVDGWVYGVRAVVEF